MSDNEKAVTALVERQYGNHSDLLKFAKLGARKKADVIVAIAQEQRAKERGQSKGAPARAGRQQDHLRSGTWIVEKVDMVDGLPVVRYLGKRLNITLHQTTDQPVESRKFNGAKAAERAAMLQGPGWEARHVSQLTRLDTWIRVEPSPMPIPQNDMGIERGLTR